MIEASKLIALDSSPVWEQLIQATLAELQKAAESPEAIKQVEVARERLRQREHELKTAQNFVSKAEFALAMAEGARKPTREDAIRKIAEIVNQHFHAK